MEDFDVILFDENHRMVQEFKSRKEFEEFCGSVDVSRWYVVDVSSSANYLDTMMKLQMMFQGRMGRYPAPLETHARTQQVMNNTLYAEAEMHEFLRELQYFKSWKTYDWDSGARALHYGAALEEFADIMHFIINMALDMGFTAADIYNAFVSKNIVNHQRQDQGY